MALFQAKDKIFGDLAVPSNRSLGPLFAHGALGNALVLNSSYVSFTPIYTNTPKVITTIQFIVVTAATSVGTPLIQIAMYQCRPNQLAPSNRIQNTFTQGIIPTTTGVKTTTFSPTFTLPKGLSFFGMNIKASADNNTCTARGLDGTGREGGLLGSLGAGFDGTSPTNNFSHAGIPYIFIGNNVNLSSDYSSATTEYSISGGQNTDKSYVGVFLK